MALVIASYLEDAEAHLPPVSIRLTCSTLLTVDDIKEASDIVRDLCKEFFFERNAENEGSESGSLSDEEDENSDSQKEE